MVKSSQVKPSQPLGPLFKLYNIDPMVNIGIRKKSTTVFNTFVYRCFWKYSCICRERTILHETNRGYHTWKHEARVKISPYAVARDFELVAELLNVFHSKHGVQRGGSEDVNTFASRSHTKYTLCCESISPLVVIRLMLTVGKPLHILANSVQDMLQRIWGRADGHPCNVKYPPKV